MRVFIMFPLIRIRFQSYFIEELPGMEEQNSVTWSYHKVGIKKATPLAWFLDCFGGAYL